MTRASDRVKKTAKEHMVWLTAIYIRLSREDGNDESLSVTNQKKIIMEYLENSFEGEYELIDCYVDDGITGTTDAGRPAFQRMIRDMERGQINCIVCKNLSRMFRNYSDQGYYLETKFPRLKIRFITVSEPRIDTYERPEVIEGLEVPINGIINDRYAAKTSRDVRDTFATKRRRGEFIGAFAPYGYRKDPKNKNRLIIDEEAAVVVRNIFDWYVYEGMSKRGMAKRLNDSGIVCPSAYKRRQGLRYRNQNPSGGTLWNQKTIHEMLKNKVYIGVMVQGRQTTVSYKVHERVAVPEEEWYIVENTHEPIVDRDTFEKAQSINKRDSRTAPEKRHVHLFAGFIRCGDCKRAMRRKTSKGYTYYSCRGNTDYGICTKHSIREDTIYQTVLAVIQKQIALAVNKKDFIAAICREPVLGCRNHGFENLLIYREREFGKIAAAKDSLYGDWKNGDITREEYHHLKEKYEMQLQQIGGVIDNLKREAEASKSMEGGSSRFQSFIKYENIESLDRALLMDLVDFIYVYQNKEIEIKFKFADRHNPFEEVMKSGQ